MKRVEVHSEPPAKKMMNAERGTMNGGGKKTEGRRQEAEGKSFSLLLLLLYSVSCLLNSFPYSSFIVHHSSFN
jgi:hypothetical protein